MRRVPPRSIRLADSPRLALVGGESLAGRDIRDILAANILGRDLKLIAGASEDAGKITEREGEATFLAHLDADSLAGAAVVFLTGAADSAARAFELAPAGALIDLTYGLEENPRARLRAPMVEPPGYELPPGSIHVMAHPAAIALALVLDRIHRAFPIRRAVAHVFEPASERGAAGLEELQQQTVNLLSFKPLPRATFDEQLAFNLLARYGEDAPAALADSELRIERHLATLLANASGAPMPSLRLIQAPVFHGHSFSLWLGFNRKPGVEALESALESGYVDLRRTAAAPPNNAGVAGEKGVSVGAISADRNDPQACWLWMASDNIRLQAENAVEVLRELV